MYAQFFGNFLLNEGVINSEQLLEILKTQTDVKVKLGTLAMAAGYMTASEVERIHILVIYLSTAVFYMKSQVQ